MYPDANGGLSEAYRIAGKRRQTYAHVKKPFIVVLGPQGAGKSTVARLLGEQLGLNVAETGEILIREFAELQHAVGWPDATVDQWIEYVSKRKGSYRAALIALADKFRRADPAYLMHLAAERGQIIVGPRKVDEVQWWIEIEKEMEDPVPFIFVKNRNHPPIADGYEIRHEHVAKYGPVGEVSVDGGEPMNLGTIVDFLRENGFHG